MSTIRVVVNTYEHNKKTLMNTLLSVLNPYYFRGTLRFISVKQGDNGFHVNTTSVCNQILAHNSSYEVYNRACVTLSDMTEKN